MYELVVDRVIARIMTVSPILGYVLRLRIECGKSPTTINTRGCFPGSNIPVCIPLDGGIVLIRQVQASRFITYTLITLNNVHMIWQH